MSLRRIEVATLPISVAEARANGRIDADTDDSLVEIHIRAATAHAERLCGCAFSPQVWELVLDSFPSKEISLIMGPVSEVVSIKAIDLAGAEQTVDAADYVVDTASRVGWVVPVASWPATMETINAVVVRFITGTIEPDAKQAILLLTEHYYENRADGSEASVTSIPFGVRELLSLHRRWFI